MRARPVIVAAAAALLALACGSSAPDAASLPSDHALLRVDEQGTFPLYMGIEVPLRLSLAADGTLVRAAPFGATLVPAMTATTLPAATVAEAWRRAVDAGLARDAELGIEGLFDASWTTITVDGGAGRTTMRLYALGPWDDTPESDEVPAADREQRARARSFLGWLDAQDDGLPAAPYVPPTAVLVVASATGAPMTWRSVPWTGPMPLATAGDPLSGERTWDRCAFVRGDAARAVIELATSTPAETAFSDAGADWFVAVRPVLPGEPTDCRTVAN